MRKRAADLRGDGLLIAFAEPTPGDETVPIAARHGLPMMSAFIVLDEALAERREVYRRASAEHGHAPAEVEARLAQTWNIRFEARSDALAATSTAKMISRVVE